MIDGTVDVPARVWGGGGKGRSDYTPIGANLICEDDLRSLVVEMRILSVSPTAAATL